jgi:putative transcriptional regulator
MSNKFFKEIKAGMDDALAHAKGEPSEAVIHQVEVPLIDVRAVRRKLGMSQDVFARQFRVSASTIRNWEQGRRRPDGPARVLLQVIDKEPEAVKRALAR